jgi:hypothetical protein
MKDGEVMSSSRLQLITAEVQETAPNNLKAIVQLDFLEQNFLGKEPFQGGEQQKLDALVRATISAINQGLPQPMKAILHPAIKLQPQFLEEFVVVVMLNVRLESRLLKLTGCAICPSNNLAIGAARATLDATNRVIEPLLHYSRPRLFW